MTKLVLASASPRRKELLSQIGLEFTVCTGDREEIRSSTVPEEVVCELAKQKAEDVFLKLKEPEDTIVIGADTLVAKDGEILGKPGSEKAACEMLAKLADGVHAVYTGVTLIGRRGGEKWERTFYEKTDVTFYAMDEKEIAAYVATGEPMDKAGAYGIQGRGASYVKEIKGDYNNVVGLPIGRLYQELKEWSSK